MTDSQKEIIVRVLCIHYLVWFQESKEQLKTLLNNGNKVNIINLNFAQKLGLHIQKTNIETQKNDGSTLQIFGIVIADFPMKNKVGRPKFF